MDLRAEMELEKPTTMKMTANLHRTDIRFHTYFNR